MAHQRITMCSHELIAWRHDSKICDCMIICLHAWGGAMKEMISWMRQWGRQKRAGVAVLYLAYFNFHLLNKTHKADEVSSWMVCIGYTITRLHSLGKRIDGKTDGRTGPLLRVVGCLLAVDNLISQKTAGHDMIMILTAPKRISKNCRFIVFPDLNL